MAKLQEFHVQESGLAGIPIGDAVLSVERCISSDNQIELIVTDFECDTFRILHRANRNVFNIRRENKYVCAEIPEQFWDSLVIQRERALNFVKPVVLIIFGAWMLFKFAKPI